MSRRPAKQIAGCGTCYNDDDPPSWKQVGAVHGLSEKNAANEAETIRQAFQRTLLDLVGEQA